METRILQNLQVNLLRFFDDMKKRFPDEISFIVAHIAIENQLPMKDVMAYIIEFLLPMKDQVVKHNENFFLNENEFLKKLNPTSVNQFKGLWTQISDEEKETIWKYFETFLKLAELYNKSSSV